MCHRNHFDHVQKHAVDEVERKSSKYEPAAVATESRPNPGRFLNSSNSDVKIDQE